MATKKFIQHAFDAAGLEMSTGKNLDRTDERVQVVLNYPKNTKVTLSGDPVILNQILHRLDQQVIECKL